MTLAVIPCAPAGQASWTQRTSLVGTDYLFSFRWSQRDGHWYLDLADQDGVPIATGRKLVAGFPLLRGVVDSRAPAGGLVVLDTTGANDLDPGFTDLGGRFVLVFYQPGDV